MIGIIRGITAFLLYELISYTYGDSYKLQYNPEDLSPAQLAVVQAAERGEPEALVTVGEALLRERSTFGPGNPDLAMKFFLQAAESNLFKPMANIGQMYAVGNGVRKSTSQALIWFDKAADLGHQGSMYNCGLIYAQGDPVEGIPVDLVAALEYFQQAYVAGMEMLPSYSEQTTNAAKIAHELVSEKLSTMNIHGLNSLTRVWMASNLQSKSELQHAEVLKKINKLWDQGVKALVQFDRAFKDSGGAINEDVREIVTVIVQVLTTLSNSYAHHLTHLQLYLVLDNLQDALGPLAGKDEHFASLAGTFAEMMAMSHYCKGRFAVWESDSACFNGAMSSAMSYYRRANESAAVLRVFASAREHASAGTHWKYIQQTPRIYHERLRSSPWWQSENFQLTAALKAMYRVNGGRTLQTQLDDMIQLKQGALRNVHTPDVEDSLRYQQQKNRAEESIDRTQHGQGPEGLKRIFTPSIGVRAANSSVEEDGAGAWAEFGPLYNGVEWNEENCAVLPLVCETLRQYVKQSGGQSELCGTHTRVVASGSSGGDSADTQAAQRRVVEEQCGSDTIVTLLRLQPGAHILPHCGTTNRRLIMHFVLRGAKGVDFRVGDNATTAQAWASAMSNDLEHNRLAELQVPLSSSSSTDTNSGPFGGFDVKIDARYQPRRIRSMRYEESMSSSSSVDVVDVDATGAATSRDIHTSKDNVEGGLGARLSRWFRGKKNAPSSSNRAPSSSYLQEQQQQGQQQKQQQRQQEPASAWTAFIQSEGGWVHSYASADTTTSTTAAAAAAAEEEEETLLLETGGRAIVFDDSFEHEVEHKGDEARYVLLIVLKHPDIIYPAQYVI